MLIGIEAERANALEKTGVEHYAQQLILHLAKIDSKNRYRLYLRTFPQEWFKSLPENFEIRVIPFPKFWTQVRLSIELFLHSVDVLLVPASALPLYHPKKCICTIHDTAFIYYPEADTSFMRKFLHYSYKFIAKQAWKIIAISKSTKDDLVKFYKMNPEKIEVIHHGYEKNLVNSEKWVVGSKEIQLPEKYVLFVSTLQPRKNLEGLIRAFRQLKNNRPDLQHKLVVVGKPGWKFEKIIQTIEDNKDIVVYLGHVSKEDKWAIYKKADAFVHASFYEGFGMWILEAFDAGIPVAVSNVSSLPEVAGLAAVYFDPHNDEEITSALDKILFNERLRSELVIEGKDQLKNFSWEKAARETLALIES